MSDVLVPIGDTGEARWGAEQAIALYRREPGIVHLLCVQRPLPRHVAQFFAGNELSDYYRDAGLQALAPAVAMLDEAGVPHREHVRVGKPAETVVGFAHELGLDRVVLDAEARGPLSMLGLGSLGSQVRHLMGAAKPANTPA